MNSKMPRLNADEADYLLEALSNETWQVLEKWIDFYVKTMQESMVQFNLQNGEDEQELIRRKLRADGAARLLGMLKSSRESLKTKNKRVRTKKKVTR